MLQKSFKLETSKRILIVMFSIDSTIIAALVGAFSAWALTYFTEEYKIYKKKKGASIILKSEIELNLTNIKNFKKFYLNVTTKELYDSGTLEDISNFYYYLTKFPIINHENWDRLINFVPDVYDDFQIKKVIEFNSKLDNLFDECKRLSEKGMPKVTYSAFLLYELEPEDYEITIGAFESFENQIRNTIECGEDLLKSIS